MGGQVAGGGWDTSFPDLTKVPLWNDCLIHLCGYGDPGYADLKAEELMEQSFF